MASYDKTKKIIQPPGRQLIGICDVSCVDLGTFVRLDNQQPSKLTHLARATNETIREVVAVYIRPEAVDISDMLKTLGDRESRRFEGMDVEDLRARILEAFGSLEPIKKEELPNKVYFLAYTKSNKNFIYSAVGKLFT